jgi:hypothetical protein
MSDAVAALIDAAESLRAVRERVTAVDGDLDAVSDAYRDLVATLDRHEEAATGYGEFEKYVQFQEAIAERIDAVDDATPASGAFAAADEALQRRTLSSADFDRAREALEPAAEHAALREERREARERYRETRRAVRREREAVRDRLADLERLRRLGDADLDAPVARLREPIATYDERVEEAFRSFRRSVSARELLAVVDRAARTPLVSYDRPPERLRAYVRQHDAGEETVGTLREYAGYSTSKLDHYVDDPRALKGAVESNCTALDRLDAEPLTVGWPPPPAERLRWRARELVSLVGRIADETTVARLRAVRALPRETDYERLRESALARAELGAEERARIQGDLESELAAVRERRERLDAVLAEHPPLADLDA